MQFDLLVNQYKMGNINSSFKLLIDQDEKKEFDEKDEIIAEKESEIKKLCSTREYFDIAQVDLTKKNLQLKEYENEITMLRDIQKGNDVSDFIEAEN